MVDNISIQKKSGLDTPVLNQQLKISLKIADNISTMWYVNGLCISDLVSINYFRENQIVGVYYINFYES